MIIGQAGETLFMSKCLDDDVKEQHEYKFKIDSLWEEYKDEIKLLRKQHSTLHHGRASTWDSIYGPAREKCMIKEFERDKSLKMELWRCNKDFFEMKLRIENYYYLKERPMESWNSLPGYEDTNKLIGEPYK